MAPTMGDEDRIVVGIDFGTTYSGVAAVYSATPEAVDDISVIKTWPGGNNATSDKVPSEIAYGPPPTARSASTPYNPPSRGGRGFVRGRGRGGSPSSGSSAPWDFTSMNSSLGDDDAPRPDQLRWGFQIRPEEDRLRCMKLLLDPRQQLPANIAQGDLRGQLRRTGKDAQTVVTDYLTELWKHAKGELERRYGQYFVATTRMDLVLTVPAIWSDAAKDATRKAAERAGIGSNIRMISEPEAAAVYTLKSIQPNHLHPGNNFIVCDAGGGTVDLISYEVEQTSPLRVKESTEGTGGCCGAAVLNMRFTDHVSSIMGAATFEDIRKRKPRSWQTALKFFDDYVKKNFDPDDKDGESSIPFPLNDGETPCVDQGFLTIYNTDLRAIFMPVIEDVIELVQGQVSRLEALGRPVNGIVLVGGFGQSNCLFKCLQERFKDLAPPPPYPGSQGHRRQQEIQFEVMQPANAWTAVVRGAVLRGLEGTELVLSRKSRRHYGSTYATTFNSRIHSNCAKVWNDCEDTWHAHGNMHWYLSKGQVCEADKPVTFDLYINIKEGDSKIHESCLMVCDDDEAPRVNFESNSVRTLCTLTTDLSQVPSHFWTQKVNSMGGKYQSLGFTLGVRVESGGLRFDLRVGNLTYGEVTASFN